jgi:hypothetical protein
LWVDGEVAEELACGGVDDSDVEVLDEQEEQVHLPGGPWSSMGSGDEFFRDLHLSMEPV